MDDLSGNGQFRDLLERSPAGLLVTTLEGEILTANRASAQCLGFESPEELKQTNVREHYVDPEQREKLIEHIERRGTVTNVELLMETRDGDLRWLLTSINAHYDDGRDTTLLFGTWVDITEQRELREELEHRADHDLLTGLLNRRALFERSAQVLAMCDRENLRAAVVYLDIAGFRHVNAQLGHQGGDQILTAVGTRLRESLRDADLISRIGGDEFVIVATLIRDGEDADQVGRRVRHAFDAPYDGSEGPLNLEPAIGIAVFPEDGSDLDKLLHRADEALWGPDRNKPPGIRRYRAAGAGTEASPSWDVASDLKRALQRGGELFQVYQPVVSAEEQVVIGVESLVRWDHPEHGQLRPGSFIPEAEASGLIRQVDRAVFRESVRQAAEWRDEGLPLEWVSINLSAQSLSDPSCVEWAEGVLGQHDELRPGQVVIEVTEHTAMQQVARTDTLDRLRDEVGLLISIDDFGIGYSSLLYLRQFPANYLKIDREFVKDVADNPADRKVIRGILAMGEAFEMEIIAEGVETEAQEEWLREAGCDYLQGYRFGRPDRAEETERYLEASG